MAMTCNVICSSRTGNTALLAETVWETARELETEGERERRRGSHICRILDGQGGLQ